MPVFNAFILRLALCFALVTGLGGAKTLNGDGFTVVSEHMTAREAKDVFERARDGYDAVTRYLRLKPKQKIVIKDVDTGATGNGRTTIKMVQGSTEAVAPIQIQIPLRYLRSKPFKTAIVHELTHAVAGVPFKSSAFLAEGLAVHVHGVLARTDEDDSFANFAIHDQAHRRLRQVATVNPIQHLARTPEIFAEGHGTFGSGFNQEAGYVLAGSFVTYLIQKDGPARLEDAVARFLRVYREGDFAGAYGKPLATLEREWISFLYKKPKARFRAAP